MQSNFSRLALPLFPLWPFGSFLFALNNLSKKSSAIVITLFGALFGYSFSFTDKSADSYRIAYYFTNFEFKSFNDILIQYNSGATADIYNILMFSVTKIFSENPKVLYSLCGLIFGYFMYKGLELFARIGNSNRDWHYIIIAIAFFSLNPLTNVNGFRFWTAAWYFFYFILKWKLLKDNKAILFLLFTPLFHFSFLFLILSVIIFYILIKWSNKEKILPLLWFVFILTYVFSWFLDFNIINFDFLQDYLSFNSTIAYKLEFYTSESVVEDVLERRNSTFHTVSIFFGFLKKIYVLFVIGSLYRWYKKTSDKVDVNFLILVLFMLIFSNLVLVIPSGGRFYMIAIMLLLTLLVHSRKSLNINVNNKFKLLALIALPVFSFDIAFVVGLLSYVLVNPYIWLGNLYIIIIEGLDFYHNF